VWLAGLGALARSQAEDNELFDTLVREGEGVENQMREITESKVEEVKGRITTTWDELEKAFNERISGIMDSLGLSTKDDLEKLSHKLDEVDRKLAQEQRKSSG
jgi:poly(hydroxyalkanoate) granule-associated protein